MADLNDLPLLITKHCRITPAPEDGTRILTMRRWPRGVRRDRFDVWLRDLAPSEGLLKWCWAEEANPQFDPERYERTWKARYVAEMQAQQRLINDLRRRHRAGETLTLLCACHDPARCHRAVLASLIVGHAS